MGYTPITIQMLLEEKIISHVGLRFNMFHAEHILPALHPADGRPPTIIVTVFIVDTVVGEHEISTVRMSVEHNWFRLLVEQSADDC